MPPQPIPTPRRGSRLSALLVLAAAGLLLWSSAHGQNTGPAWNDLSRSQRQALQPLQRDWASIEPQRREKWVELASRFDRLSPDEQARVQQRMTDWARMSPRQREAARLNYQDARQVSPQDRQQRWRDYQALPEDQRRELADRARQDAQRPSPRTSPERSGSPSKVNTVPNPLTEGRKPKPVAPSVVQSKPGVSTRLLTPLESQNQQTGLPKVATTPEFVDSATLLPRRGPQGAAAEPPPRKR